VAQPYKESKKIKMDRNELSVFKIKYVWYEGEEYWDYLAKNVTQEQFEKDIKQARDFANSLIGKKLIKFDESHLGKGYSTECLPEFYAQIIWYLTKKKKYKECDIYKDDTYFVDEDLSKIIISKRTKTVRDETL
jgi:hypothetical protein